MPFMYCDQLSEINYYGSWTRLALNNISNSGSKIKIMELELPVQMELACQT